jgi:hypothetical protein
VTGTRPPWQFALAAICVLLTLAVLLLLMPRSSRPSVSTPNRAGSNEASTVLSASTPAATPSLSADNQPGFLTARAFAQAFLSYETGDLSPPVRRTVRRLTTAPLARTLLSEPPRARGGGSREPGVLAGLSVVESGRIRMAYVAYLQYAETAGILRLTLRRAAGRWRVADLR